MQMAEVSYSQPFTHPIADLQASDSDRTRLLLRLSIAFGVLALTSGGVLIGLALLDVLPDQLFLPALLSALLAGAVIASTIVLARSNRRVATITFLYGIVLYVSMTIYLLNGVTGPAFLAYLIPVMAAGLFGKASDSIRLFVVALGCYIVLALLQGFEVLTPALPLSGADAMIVFVVGFLTVGGLLAYLALLWSNTTTHLLNQAQEQSEALLRSNEKLLEKNIQQVELGSELSAAAAELLAASHQQASGATEQASAVSQVSTTIEELGSTARQIAIAAEQVAEAAQQTLENLSEGQDAVDRSIQAMERIRNRVADVSTRVLSLGERSQQIGEIIDLINDLSDETHLLALNAAIEAAGAGEHGRRFAVVAAEVKSLANRALAAAKEVKGVIAEIQQATNAAVLAAEEGGKEVERGVELAHSAGQVMDSIVMVAERTAQSGAEINLATAQQQSASEQVVETMREVADVARQTATGARQMSESAQMLTAIAERLHGIVYESPQATLPRMYTAEIDERLRRLSSEKEMRDER
jgi:methyl-accepting chemotaxis protein